MVIVRLVASGAIDLDRGAFLLREIGLLSDCKAL